MCAKVMSQFLEKVVRLLEETDEQICGWAPNGLTFFVKQVQNADPLPIAN